MTARGPAGVMSRWEGRGEEGAWPGRPGLCPLCVREQILALTPEDGDGHLPGPWWEARELSP